MPGAPNMRRGAQPRVLASKSRLVECPYFYTDVETYLEVVLVSGGGSEQGQRR